MIGKAKIPLLAGKGPEVLITAVVVTAFDPGHSQGIVTAFQELVHTVGNAIETESAVVSSVVLFVGQGESIYMVSQNGLQDIP